MATASFTNISAWRHLDKKRELKTGENEKSPEVTISHSPEIIQSTESSMLMLPAAAL
jgi:hypothetical protein